MSLVRLFNSSLEWLVGPMKPWLGFGTESYPLLTKNSTHRIRNWKRLSVFSLLMFHHSSSIPFTSRMKTRTGTLWTWPTSRLKQKWNSWDKLLSTSGWVISNFWQILCSVVRCQRLITIWNTFLRGISMIVWPIQDWPFPTPTLCTSGRTFSWRSLASTTSWRPDLAKRRRRWWPSTRFCDI